MGSSEQVGAEIDDLIEELFPICRSITGNGVRETLRLLQRLIPLEVHEVPSGTPVLDWTVPNEWNIRDAWIKDAAGTKVVDFQRSNLHVVNYSVPIHCRMPLQELRPASLHDSRAPGLDPLSNVLLPRNVGVLSVAQPVAADVRRRL